MFNIAVMGIVANFIMLCLLSGNKLIAKVMALGQRGAVGDPPPPVPPVKVEFTKEQQAVVDDIVQTRLARERDRYKDYDELVKFKTDNQKQLDAQTQKDLEAKKEYDKAKELSEGKIKELSGVITVKDQTIVDMKIGHSLNNELSKQNAYIEAAMALLKSQVIYDKDGNMFIKSKDANNIDVNLTIEQGVKDFLTQRPYLVKATSRAGAGSTGAAAGEGSAAAGAEDLKTLNQQYAAAQTRGDHKGAQELRVKIQKALTAQGINRNP